MHTDLYKRIALALAVFAVGGVFAAAPASAAVCDTDLVDAKGQMWDLSGDGSVDDGTDDSYDDSSDLLVGTSGDGFTPYATAGGDACGREEDGREVTYPEQTLKGLAVSRKVYVPDSGLGFARWLDTLRNPTEAPVTLQYAYLHDLGHSETVFTSDGDDVAELGDLWFAQTQNSSHVSVPTGMWDGAFADDAFDELIEGPGPSNDESEVRYDVTVEPGETLTFMHIEHQATSGAAGRDFAAENEAGHPDFFAGMSSAELDALRNWTFDRDDDGVRDDTDNCTSVANTDQQDMDGDGEGDACDDDIDGDGLTNAQEERLGMNPRSTDSDGDGQADGVDRCPTRAGTEADGCPAPTTVTQTQQSQQQVIVQSQILQRLRARRLIANVSRKRTERGLRIKTSGRLLLPAGVSAEQGCNGSVLVIVKSRKRTISTRRAKLSKTCRYRSKVTFTLPGRLDDRQLKVLATFQGNRRIFRQRAKSSTVGRP